MIRLFLLVVALAQGTLSACPRGQKNHHKTRRVIVDLDAGGDDAWALIMLLMNEVKYNVCVQAITCSHGNTEIDHVAVNVARILKALGRVDIPVYKGSRERLITPAPHRDVSGYFWGVDGFGDIEFKKAPNMAVVKQDHAVVKMGELLREYPKQITIVALAPLTNLALLFKMFPEAKQHIADIFILGGNRNGVGNTDFAAEFNFFDDPEAANIVLNNSPVKLNIFPWETILKLSNVFTTRWRLDTFAKTKNKAIQLLNRVEKVVYANYTGWTPCDMYAAAVFMEKKLVTEVNSYKAGVELNGKLTRGMMPILHHVTDEKQFNVNVIDEVDQELLKQMLLGLDG